ncbi:hypothetical protein SK128_005854 [Halocaridina rubra]|uniref:Major facilitator superfamily (MFS) profile domain-containing protein n=1 Tax=Halocaridina rubra TaxID=373956 RepID=A0AAN8XEN2_HALRR
MLHSELQDMEVVCVQNAKSDYMKYEVLESASCAGDNTDSNIHVVIQNDCQGTDFQCTPKSEKIVDIEHNHTPVLNTSETSCEIIAENNRLEYDKSEVDGELEFSQNCEVVNDRNSEKCPEDRLPDGGWGWVVVFGASLILVLVDTIGQCFGIIFSSFLLDLETPTAVTAWIFNIFSFTWCMTGPPLGPLITEYGWRSLSFIGSFLLATATVTSAFVSAAWVLFFTHSLLAGVGCGIISNISYMIVPHYFKKRRGLANGIIMAFDCGGQFFGPPLIDFLQQEYTFKGATLILSGVILNCCVGAAVFQPVEWHLKPQAPKILKTEEREALIRKECGTQPAGSSENLARKLLRILKSTVADLVILKSARAMIISVAATVIFTGYLNFLAIVPFAMRENGFTLKDSAMCVSVSAICNMITRVIVASLSDTKWFNYRISMMIGSLTISGTMVCKYVQCLVKYSARI